VFAFQGSIHDARDALAEARTRRTKRVQEPSDPRVTLSQVIEQYEEAHAGDRANTREVRKHAFVHIRKALGTKRITAITRADIRKWVAQGRRALDSAGSASCTNLARKRDFHL
jgi:Phage integrase, N-terminal SAM-like domain